MANANIVILAGNLTQKPELRYTPGGHAVTDLAVATSRKFKTSAGELKEETTYVDCSVFGKQAESCAKYLEKGRAVFIQGRLRLDQWDDSSTGEKRRKLKIVAERVQFLEHGRSVPPNARDGIGSAVLDSRRNGGTAAPSEVPADTDLPLDDDVPF